MGNYNSFQKRHNKTKHQTTSINKTFHFIIPSYRAGDHIIILDLEILLDILRYSFLKMTTPTSPLSMSPLSSSPPESDPSHKDDSEVDIGKARMLLASALAQLPREELEPVAEALGIDAGTYSNVQKLAKVIRY